MNKISCLKILGIAVLYVVTVFATAFLGIFPLMPGCSSQLLQPYSGRAVQRVATVIQLVVVYHRDERMPLELIRLHQQELWCPDVSGVAVDVVYL